MSQEKNGTQKESVSSCSESSIKWRQRLMQMGDAAAKLSIQFAAQSTNDCRKCRKCSTQNNWSKG